MTDLFKKIFEIRVEAEIDRGLMFKRCLAAVLKEKNISRIRRLPEGLYRFVGEFLDTVNYRLRVDRLGVRRRPDDDAVRNTGGSKFPLAEGAYHHR